MQLIRARLDFCTETVFSHESRVDLVTAAADVGHNVVLHIVMIPVELSGPRVAKRVVAGGHDVPDEKLEPRYRWLWPLVAAAVPHCRRTVAYDNAVDHGPIEIASLRYGVHDYRPRWPDWAPDAMTVPVTSSNSFIFGGGNVPLVLARDGCGLARWGP